MVPTVTTNLNHRRRSGWPRDLRDEGPAGPDRTDRLNADEMEALRQKTARL